LKRTDIPSDRISQSLEGGIVDADCDGGAKPERGGMPESPAGTTVACGNFPKAV
jgi:hypothetical protein